MLVIRLQRTGRSKVPDYRLVVAEKARPVKGKYVEILGHFLPSRTSPVQDIKLDRVKYWVTKGAAPSSTTARLLKRLGVDGMDSFIERYTKKKSKKEQPAEAAAPSTPAAA